MITCTYTIIKYIIFRWIIQVVNSRCYPCEVRYPKCEDKNDGLLTQPKERFSSNYMICKDNRTIETGHCPADKVWAAAAFPYKA